MPLNVIRFFDCHYVHVSDIVLITFSVHGSGNNKNNAVTLEVTYISDNNSYD